MLIPSTKKILIVPDFGLSADDKAMAALKTTIEATDRYSVMIADLPQMVLNENRGEQLKDSQLIELCARRLESFAADKTLVWDEHNDFESFEEFALIDDIDSINNIDNIENIEPEPDEKRINTSARKLNIKISKSSYCDLDQSAPDAIVVFGKSAMLAGDVKGKDILFINPEYTDAAPWHDQLLAYNKGRDEFETYFQERINEPINTYVWDGVEVNRRPRPIVRHIIEEDDLEKQAAIICEFTEGKVPILPEKDESSKKRILIIPDYFIPFNATHIVELRECLRQLGYYAAVVAAGDTLERTRIGIERRCKKKPFDLIVTLESGCLFAARITNAPRIFVNPEWEAWKWMKQRLGDKKELIEHRCTDNIGPFYAYHLNIKEIIEAQQMRERSYIRKAENPVVGWLTADMIDSHKVEEHSKRFNSVSHLPIANLTSQNNIKSLAKEIDKYFNNDN